IESIFSGTDMMATSVGITARVLRDLGQLDSSESRVILGAAVIDDILAMVALAVVSGLATTGSVRLSEVVLVVAEALLFTLFVALGGTRTVRRYGHQLTRLRMEGAPLAISLLVMLGLASLSAQIGLAAIIGAFLAGMAFAEAPDEFDLERQVLPIYQFLVPYFFVLTGSQVDWRLFTNGGLMALALGITFLAILGKLLGCGLPMIPFGVRSAAIVGVGMVPRGEVGLIVASLGLTMGVVAVEIFSVVVIMSILTTIVAPPVLAALFAGRGMPRPEGEEEGEERAQLPDL
ncbi:MAG TPA: cation:proton antiporter, partial [Chloroflexota bacterium]|nr:cation:proton antiporter [Chloroflexota bacterium]